VLLPVLTAALPCSLPPPPPPPPPPSAARPPHQDARLIESNCQAYCSVRFPALPPLAAAVVAAMESALAAAHVAEELAAAEREAAVGSASAAAAVVGAASAARGKAAEEHVEVPRQFTAVLRLHRVIPGSTYAVPGKSRPPRDSLPPPPPLSPPLSPPLLLLSLRFLCCIRRCMC
jgi:hypothetical protein